MSNAAFDEMYPTPPSSRVSTPLLKKNEEANTFDNRTRSKETRLANEKQRQEKEKETEYPKIERQQIAKMIVNKQYIIIYRDAVYNLTEWADLHPGGRLAILHMVGRDATAQINAYHDTMIEARMKKFKFATLKETVWDSLIPPIHLGWNANLQDKGDNIIVTDPSLLLPKKQLPYAITEKDLEPESNKETSAQKMYKENKAYNELNAKLRSLGLYKAKPLAYMYDIARYATLISVCIGAYRNGNWLISALALGFLWQQLVFAVHDAGHLAITGKYHKDTAIGCGIASFLGGLSVLWWKHNHNVHHIVCNDVEHDPDIQHVPFMAISSKFYDNIHSSYYSRRVLYCAIARTMIPLQHMCYYLIMSLARFNLYVLSYGFLIKEKKSKYHYIELAGVLVFWTWYSMLMAGLPDWSTRVLYTLVSHMVTGILHVQITLSHFGMPTNPLGSRESYASLQLRTTMDVDCPWYLDFFHGGLQNQVSHHLFPRVPKHNLPEVKLLVQEFAKANELPYTIHTFSKGNGVVLGVLKDVANQVSLLAEVAKAGAEGKIVIELDGF